MDAVLVARRRGAGWALAGAGLVGILCALSGAAWGDVNGVVRGTVRDEAGRPLAGTVVVLTSSVLQGERAALADVDGHYVVAALPPGTYRARFFFGDVARPRLVRRGLHLRANATLVVNAALRMRQAQGQEVSASSHGPALEGGTTRVVTTFTPVELGALPLGRELPRALRLRPDPHLGLDADLRIDGIDVGRVFGPPGSGPVPAGLPVRVIEELQLVSGGVAAEHAGPSLVSVVTRRGRDELHGAVWLHTSPFGAAPRAVGRLHEALTRTIHGREACAGDTYCLELGARVGGPILKDRLWFYGAVMLEVGWLEWERRYRGQVDADGDGVADRVDEGSDRLLGPASSPGGSVAQRSALASVCPGYLADAGLCGGRRASPVLVDRGASPTYTRVRRTVRFQTKLSYRPGPRHDVELTLLGAPGTITGDDPTRGVGSIDRAGVDVTFATYDVALRWLTKLWRHKIQPAVTLTYHHERMRDSPTVAETPAVRHRGPQSLAALGTVADGFPAACVDPDPTDAFIPCPVSGFVTGGSGLYGSYEGHRVGLLLRAAAYLRGVGHHAVTVGLDPELSFLSATRRLSGGVLFDSLEIDGEAGVVATEAAMTSQVGGRRVAAFVQDRWAILPNLTLSLGVRWEGQQLVTDGGVDGAASRELGIWDSWGPRIGITYDFTGDGRSRLFAAYGRFFDALPAGTFGRAFGDEVLLRQQWWYASAGDRAATCGVGVGLSPAACRPSSAALTGAPGEPVRVVQSVDGGARVVPGLEAERSDEIVLGAQHELFPDCVVGATYRRRWLGTAVAELSPDGGQTSYLANPGRAPATAELEEQIARLEEQRDPTSLAHLAELRETLAHYHALERVPPATRDEHAVELSLEKRFSRRWLLGAAYVYSRTIGNAPGPVVILGPTGSPTVTRPVALTDLLPHNDGPLPQDTPHTLLVSGARRFGVGANGALITGLVLRAASGYPINVVGGAVSGTALSGGGYPGSLSDLSTLGGSAAGSAGALGSSAAASSGSLGSSGAASAGSRGTADGTVAGPVVAPAGLPAVLLLPRGAGGRTPWLYAADLKLAYQHRLAPGLTLAVSLELFNVLNLRRTVVVDEVYTEDWTLPIISGSVADLRHLKTSDGRPVRASGNYGHTVAYQLPFSGRLGVQLSF